MRIFWRRLFLLAAAMASMFLSGCAETSQWTINPDGSGKVTFTQQTLPWSQVSRFVQSKDAKPIDADLLCVSTLRLLLQHFEGFDAWCDCEYSEDHDFTRLTFTGYFPDISKVKLNLNTKEGERTLFTEQTSKRDAKGRWILTLSTGKTATTEPKDRPKQSGGNNEDEDTKVLSRELMQNMADFMKLAEPFTKSPMFKDLRDRMEITVKGEITEAEGLNQESPSVASREIHFRDRWDLVRRMMTDRELMQAIAGEMRGQGVSMNGIDWTKATEESAQAFQAFMERNDPTLHTPMILTITPQAKGFDYAKEVADAASHPGELLRRIRAGEGLDHPVLGTSMPMIGIVFQKDEPVIEKFMPNSTAEAAGLKIGDRVAEVNGNSIDKPSEVGRFIRQMGIGDKAKLKIERDGQSFEKTVKVTTAGELTAPARSNADGDTGAKATPSASRSKGTSRK